MARHEEEQQDPLGEEPYTVTDTGVKIYKGDTWSQTIGGGERTTIGGSQKIRKSKIEADKDAARGKEKRKKIADAGQLELPFDFPDTFSIPGQLRQLEFPGFLVSMSKSWIRGLRDKVAGDFRTIPRQQLIRTVA